MLAKILKTAIADIPAGTTGKARVAVEIENRICSFDFWEVELLPETGEQTPTIAIQAQGGPIQTGDTATIPDKPPIRLSMPDTRPSITHKFDIAGNKGYISVSHENGKPFEVFITLNKTGGSLSGFVNCFARAFSLLLQQGTPLEFLVRKFAYHRFEPSGHTTHPQIGHATSVIDYLARFLGYQFLPGYTSKQPEELPHIV